MFFIGYDGHCMFYGNGIYFIKCVFYSFLRNLELFFKYLYRKDVYCSFCFNNNDYK